MSSLLSSDVLMSRHLSTAQVTRAFAWCLGLCVMELPTVLTGVMRRQTTAILSKSPGVD